MESSPEALTAELLSRTREMPVDDTDQRLGVATAAIVELGIADSVSILERVGDHEFTTRAPTDDRATAVDRLQREIHEGPGVEASYDEGVVCSNDIGADERWPHWGPAAVQEGIAAVISVQLYVKDDTMGALNMFHATRARHRIGQAQGILMERFQIPADAAFAVLQRLSQQGSTKLHLIADDIVRTGQLPPGADSAVQG